ncbi:Ras-related protein Rab-13, partial [Hondaea fermentalgiana]
GRCKLMVVGQGAAGKTSVVRSLLGMPPVAEHLSTVGVELKRTDAESWKEIENLDSGFERQACRVAALRMAAQERAASKKRQSLPKRISRKASDLVFGRRRSSAAQPFVAEVQVELVPEAEVARRFDIAEIENMAGKTQSGEKIYFTIWDYAGQEVFYALHHIFLTREGGIFMLVFDMLELLTKQEQALEYLSFWLNSVRLHAPKAPVLLVGTHYDQASNRGSLQTVEKTLRDTLEALRGVKLVKNQAQRLSFFPIDNMSSAADRAVELRRAVEKSASKLESVSQKISLRWLKVIDDLMKLEYDHVPFATVQELADQYHAGDQTDELLKFFHELGMLVHLRATDTLHDKVVLNPQWLLDKLARVIADEIHVQEIYFDERLADLELEDDFVLLRRKGIATRTLLDFLWDGEEVGYLEEFMRDTMLSSNWKFPERSLPRHRRNETLYLVSSLLKNSRDSGIQRDIASLSNGLTCVLDFSEFYLPDGVFARLLSLCAERSGKSSTRVGAPRLAGQQAIIRFGLSEFALEETGNQIRLIMVPGTENPASTLKTLISMFRGARDAVFKDLPWQLHLQSPQNPLVRVEYDTLVESRDANAVAVASVGLGNARVADFKPFFTDGSLTEDEHDTGHVELASVRQLGAGLEYHQLSPLVRLVTSDVVAAASGKVAGFVYEVDAASGRDVVFHLDVSGSENLELREGTGRMKKTSIAGGSPRTEVGKVMVTDKDKPWSLQCRYTWTEKETTSKEVASGIVLETTDMWTKGRSMTAIEYTLRSSLHKRVVFTMDFSGSENLDLATGGLKLRTVVEPTSTATVGYLQVINPMLQWKLKCKYQWSEELPDRPVVGRPERRELSPGIVLITTRTETGGADAFRYQLACSKNAVIDFRLDCSDSTNVALKDNESSAKLRTVVQPWDRVDVGTIIVTNPAKPWSLKCKFSWTERPPKPPTFAASSPGTNAASSSGGADDASGAAVDAITEHISSLDVSEDDNPQINVFHVERSSSGALDGDDAQRTLGSATMDPRVSSAVPLPAKLEPIPPPGVAHRQTSVSSVQSEGTTAPPIHVSVPMAPPKPENDSGVADKDESSADCKEIASNIFLTTLRIPGEPMRIRYKLEVRKPAKVTFRGDFSGSTNLALKDEDSPLKREVVVEPFKATTVAELRLIDWSPSTNWSLRCNYTFEEHDVMLETRARPSISGASDAGSAAGGTEDELSQFLAGLGLSEYLAAFRAEQVDMELLEEMAADEPSLRDTLRELGIAKLGPREKIVTAMRKRRVQ